MMLVVLEPTSTEGCPGVPVRYGTMPGGVKAVDVVNGAAV